MSTVVLLHFDGAPGAQTFVDEVNGLVFAADDADQTLETSKAAFGATGLSLPTVNGISTTWPSYVNLSGPFTIEFVWKTPASLSGDIRFVCANNGPTPTGDRMMFFYCSSGVLSWYSGVYGSIDSHYAFSDLTFAPNTTYRVAISRDESDVIRAFKNGVASSSTYTDGSDWTHVGRPLQIGSSHNSVSPFTGDQFAGTTATGGIDELRISDTGLYTENYTPDTEAFGASGDADGPVVSLDQFGVETLRQVGSRAVLTQFAVETLARRVGRAQVSTIVLEVLEQGTRVILAQFAVETLRRVASSAGTRGVVVLATVEVLEYPCAAEAEGLIDPGDGIHSSGANLGSGGDTFGSASDPDRPNSGTPGEGFKPFDPQPLTLQDALARTLYDMHLFFDPLGVPLTTLKLLGDYHGGASAIFTDDEVRNPGQWIWDGVDRNATLGLSCGPEAQVSLAVVEVLVTSASVEDLSSNGAKVSTVVLEILEPTKSSNLHGGVS